MLFSLSSQIGPRLVVVFMLGGLLLRNSNRQNALDLKKTRGHSVTFVIITKDRAEMIRPLVKSILQTRLVLCSIVLIDDSSNDNFIKNRRFHPICGVAPYDE